MVITNAIALYYFIQSFIKAGRTERPDLPVWDKILGV